MKNDAIATDAPDGSGALVRVKAVPGAKRDEVVGRLGDRLKVRVSAPPEGGRANGAICALLAEELGVRARDVEVAQGHASAEKVVLARGVSAQDVERRWA